MRQIAAEVPAASTGELVEAVALLTRELASRPAPESAVACMRLTETLGAALDQGEVAMAGFIRRVDASGEAQAEGFSCASAWLRHRLGMRTGRARERVTLARQLSRLTETAELAASGDLPHGYACTIADALARLDDDDAAAGERILLNLSDEGASADQVAKAGTRISELIADRDGRERPPEDARRGFARSWLKRSRCMDGGAWVKGWLNPEHSAVWDSLIEPLAKRAGSADDRDHAQRTADALHSALTRGHRRTTAMVILDADTLTDTDRPATHEDPRATPSADPCETPFGAASRDRSADSCETPSGAASRDRPAASCATSSHAAPRKRPADPPARPVGDRHERPVDDSTERTGGDSFDEYGGESPAHFGGKPCEQPADDLAGRYRSDPAGHPGSGLTAQPVGDSRRRLGDESCPQPGVTAAQSGEHWARYVDDQSAAHPRDGSVVGPGDGSVAESCDGSAARPVDGQAAQPGTGATDGGEWRGPGGGRRRSGRGPWRARLGNGALISDARARQIALSAGVSLLILGRGGIPLYLGKTARVATVYQRRVLESLYEVCAAEACHIPAALCEIHHTGGGWKAGTPTDIDRLVPLCSFHNQWVERHPHRVREHKDGRGRYVVRLTPRHEHHSRPGEPPPAEYGTAASRGP